MLYAKSLLHIFLDFLTSSYASKYVNEITYFSTIILFHCILVLVTALTYYKLSNVVILSWPNYQKLVT